MGWMDADSLREADTLDFQTKANSLIDDLKQRAAALTQPAQPPAQPFALPSLESLMPWAPKPAAQPATPLIPPAILTKPPSTGGFSLPSLESLMPWAPKTAPAQNLIAPGQNPIAGGQTLIAGGQPAAMPQGSSVPQGGDLREYARRKAASLGIDPDIAARVGESEGGFDDPTRQSDVVYQGQREQSYGPYQLNVAGGLGSTALQRGIDPRKPEDVYRAIDLALEHAAQNGWGDFHGAARVGIGPRDGIGGQPSQSTPAALPVPASNGQPAAMPQVSQPAPGVRFVPGRGYEGDVNPRQDLLSDPNKWSVCGPLGVMAFGAMTGHPVDYDTAIRVAADAGWTPDKGMAGPASQVAALRAIGVPAKTGPIDLDTIAREVRNGNPVGLSSPGADGHYFTVQGVDDQGRLDLGNSALALRASGATKRFWTLDELRSIGAIGNVTTAIYMDNPASPTPSVATAQGDMPRLPLSQPEDDPGAAGAEGPTPEPTRYGHFTPSRNDVPLQQAMNGTDTLTSRDYGSIRGQQRDLRTIDGPINVDTSPAVDYVAPGTRNRPVAGQVDEWSPPPVPSTEPYGPVDPSERNRAVRAPDEASYETGGPPPPPDRHTVDGPYPNQFGDQMSYRLPLAATGGPDTAPDAPYDPRAADEGAHEAPAESVGAGPVGPLAGPQPDEVQQAQAEATPAPYSPYGPSTDPVVDAVRRTSPEASPADASPTAPSSTMLPVWDDNGQVVGYRQESPQVRASAQESATRGPVQAQPGEPDSLPPASGLIDQAGAAVQGVGDTVEREGIVRPLVRPISNAIRAAQGRGPLTAETEPVPSIDTAAQETVRSLRSNVGAIGQGIREGNALEAGLGALGTLGDLTPSMLLADS
jgi:hypothetical protein